jgi:glyoxylase-like metal-dependent hydrolase (beta-lactamase superfamily II)/8-oxo-dGTP pyrophosphatase MutT (NUDIX family)
MSNDLIIRWQPKPGTPARPASTIVLVRDAAALQVLLVRRSQRVGDSWSGMCVFPGGGLHAADREAHGYCLGLDDAGASRSLKMPDGGLDHYIAALRECFEESGLLLAAADDGSALSSLQLSQLADLRRALNRRQLTLAQVCEQAGMRLTPSGLYFFGHWVTPPGNAKRFDTRFFVARAPDSQVATDDDNETVEQLWLHPAEAIERRQELKLGPPTISMIQWLLPHRAVDEVLRAAAALDDVPCNMGRVATGSKGIRMVSRHEPAWAELSKIDADGYGTSSYELAPGPAVRLSPRMIRVTAPNGSIMTGPGTNSYFIGGGPANEWALIDPGPPDEDHVRALLAALPGKLRWVFVTHTHKDHSPAAQAIKAATGAQLLGMQAAVPEWQDTTFIPDVPLKGGERFVLPGDSTLDVIHTPGHASNHLCYHLHEERMLFTGDHVMQGSTVVINPPDGSMSAYISSLRQLAPMDIDWIAPGHGFLMAQPRKTIEHIIAHRLQREAKVHGALRAEALPLDELLKTVYDDVHPQLLPVARRSLLAHLMKLQDDARAMENDGSWRLSS